jgi:Sugar efflux transporter for intercellular exchange
MQEFNPLPSAAAVFNCVAWIAYGFVIKNWYIWVENFLGLLAGLLLFLQAYGIGVSGRQRDMLTGVSMVIATLLPMIGALERLVLTNHGAQKKLWGFTGAPIHPDHS